MRQIFMLWKSEMVRLSWHKVEVREEFIFHTPLCVRALPGTKSVMRNMQRRNGDLI